MKSLKILTHGFRYKTINKNIRSFSDIHNNKKPDEDIIKSLDDAVVDDEFRENLDLCKTNRQFSLAKERDQSKYSFRPGVDPQKTSIILFPGQGSQYVGMAKNLIGIKNVSEMFEIASHIIGFNLLSICLDGPKTDLDNTLYSQPAVFVTSLASIEKLNQDHPEAIENCVATAGFSLGEYSALVFSGALTFEQGLELLKIRSTEMQKVAESVKSGMMTVFLNPKSKLADACKMAKEYCTERGIKDPVCSIANYLFADCKVIAGHIEALTFIENNAKDYNISKTKYLNVNGAFHTHLMQPVYKELAHALDSIGDLQDPLISVYSNVTSHRYKNSQQIKKLLCQQLIKPVKWEQTLHVLYERPENTNFPTTYECGPGNNLGVLLKMNNRKAFQTYHHII